MRSVNELRTALVWIHNSTQSIGKNEPHALPAPPFTLCRWAGKYSLTVCPGGKDGVCNYSQSLPHPLHVILQLVLLFS